jgi:hypothetical protein
MTKGMIAHLYAARRPNLPCCSTVNPTATQSAKNAVGATRAVRVTPEEGRELIY